LKSINYNIAAITGGHNVPSARYRVTNLAPFLDDLGINLDEIAPKHSRYPPRGIWNRFTWLPQVMVERASFCRRVRGYDAVILQRELISTLPSFERLVPGVKIFDVDDAIYLRKRGLAAKYASRSCDMVVCGNEYLAERFKQWNKRIEIIPTGVNIRDMRLDLNRLNSGKKIVGWIGTPGNLKFLKSISSPLAKALSKHSAELRICTSGIHDVPSELRKFTKFVKWYPGIEFEELPRWAVGLMPLIDDEWSRGKCSFKLLQYLSAGIPGIASPVGMNQIVLADGRAGKLARTEDEWFSALNDLLGDAEMNLDMGMHGRRTVEQRYSLEVIAQSWNQVIRNLI